jgi:phosphotriesterase-related protein
VTTVDTVLGAIETSELGNTLMHEHVFVLTPEIQQQYPAGWDEDARVFEAIAKLRELKERGISTIVDLTVLNMGRDVGRIARVAKEAGINVVAATGFYTFNDVSPYFSYREPAEGARDVLVDVFVNEITNEIGQTGIKASILKCATDVPGVTPGVERVLRAVAKAHLETGAPISTHTNPILERGLDQQRIFKEEGVDLGRVVIGHSGDTTDTKYLEELISNGSYIGMDRFGMDVFLPLQDRVDTLVTMCERGYADRMVLSHDHVCHCDWSDPYPPSAESVAAKKEMAPQVMPNWKYTHVIDEVVPLLRERGVSDHQVNQMLVENPRRIFENVSPY